MIDTYRHRNHIVAISAICGLLLAAAPAGGHDAHEAFSAGEPGNQKKPARTVHIEMREDGGKMLFVPDRLEVRRGEQIRFVLSNEGELNHEFILGTERELRAHAEVMKKHPHMEHDDPNAKLLGMYGVDELLWRFTKAGQFNFACLIPGHLERGMIGTITVK